MTEKLTIEEKFEVGLNELISLCLDGGMHPRDFIDGLEAELKWARQPFANPKDAMQPANNDR